MVSEVEAWSGKILKIFFVLAFVYDASAASPAMMTPKYADEMNQETTFRCDNSSLSVSIAQKYQSDVDIKSLTINSDSVDDDVIRLIEEATSGLMLVRAFDCSCDRSYNWTLKMSAIKIVKNIQGNGEYENVIVVIGFQLHEINFIKVEPL